MNDKKIDFSSDYIAPATFRNLQVFFNMQDSGHSPKKSTCHGLQPGFQINLCSASLYFPVMNKYVLFLRVL